MSIQPDELTTFATDDAYVGGTYDGQPNKVEPSTGLRASGFVPGTKLPFPRLNHLLHAAGGLADSVADLAVVNWTIKHDDDETPVGSAIAHDSRNRNVGTFTEYLFNLPGAQADYLIFRQAGEDSLVFTTDFLDWQTGGGDTGFVTGQGNGPILGQEGALTVVVWDDGGVVLKTTDGGATFSAAGTLDDSGGLGDSLGVYFGGDWLVFSTGAIQLSSDLSNVAWDSVTPPAEYIGMISPTCAATGSDGILVGTTHSADGGMLYSDGNVTDFSFVALGEAVEVRSVAWSDSMQLWFALDSSGQVWSSPPGAASWTMRMDLNGYTPRTIRAFGRCVVVGGVRLVVSRDLVNWQVVGPYPPSTQTWDRILPFRGQLVAISFNETISPGTDEFSWTSCLIAPYALGGFLP